MLFMFFKLRCEVRPGFTAHQPPIAGLPSRSPSQFIGIEVWNSVITISEGGTATIYIRPSVEIGCREKEGCELSVTADIPNVEENEKQCQPTAVANGGCGVIIKTKNWNVNRSLEISSTTTEEFGQDSIQLKIFLRTDDAYFSQPLWANYFLTPVTLYFNIKNSVYNVLMINIQKDTTMIEGRKCSATGDPHIRDFNKRNLELQLQGTYTFYKSEGNVEVQTQTEDCSGKGTAYCNCGVVVRVGRTAFMINHCNLGYWYIDYILCDDGANILDVRKRRETYFQYRGHDLLDIDIFPSIRDVDKTSGLCKEINAHLNKNDDLVEDIQFINRWRVKNEQNMFIPEDYDSIEGIDTSGTFQHCRCNDHNATKIVGKLICTPINGVTPCVQDTDYTMFHTKRCISPLRRKRSVPGFSQSNITRHKRLKRDYDSIEGIDTSGTFQHCRCNDHNATKIVGKLICTPINGVTPCVQDTDYTMFHTKRCISPLRRKRSVPGFSQSNITRHKRLKRDVSWKNGWTIKRADEYCTDLFNNSKVIDRCKGMKGLDINIGIKTCVQDIQLSGTEAFALSSISTVSSQCLYEARMNQTLREEKVEDGKSLLELVKEVSCPGECSYQGRCAKGKCICNTGYIGSDCAVSLNEPPLAHNLEAEGYCDLLVDDCTEVAVFGGRFVEHEKTKCQLNPFEVKEVKITPRGNVIVKTAVFESIGEVTCKLPSRKRRRSIDVPVIDETVTGYKVSVSNNGENYSQQLNFIIYNTECMNCSMDTESTQCVFSSDYCIMDSNCYRNGSIYNNGEDEYICNAGGKSKSWDIILKPDEKGDNHSVNGANRKSLAVLQDKAPQKWNEKPID
ncbi:hypothetical protein LOTGIDRAFT_239000 [Lottia gigantea]|uniref:Vwde helical domain-containing protein n=1 Tax=Lottia gigantea TaxID=225164 RepID=V4C9Y0_LOTGI|nr:hypothetical protein LOTGIDRAFT_239000 [Lottia gigantea]ESO98589.1 hypothetical protein LOTGIDRAFT_239000 [Lottia gigantea]